MDDTPTTGDPIVAGDALARLLSREERISDLVAFLAALDPGPLLKALDLTARKPRVSREEMLRGAGRADLMVWEGNRPLALLEVKMAAAQHGDQFDRYDLWARAQVPEVRCHLVCLDPDQQDAPDGWSTAPSLPELLRFWRGSDHPHAGWLASSAAAILEDWVAQVNGKIGRASHSVVADLVTRQVARDLESVERLSHLGLDVRPGRTSGGTASIVAWLPYRNEPRERGAWICVDLRSMSRADPQRPWVLRLGVEVEIRDSLTQQARADAHDLAVPMRASLTCTALQEALQRVGRKDLAVFLHPGRGTYDGLRGEPDESTLTAWRTSVLESEKNNGHPALFNDWGRRLASQIQVDVVGLDRHQLLDLLVIALEHLDRSADRRP